MSGTPDPSDGQPTILSLPVAAQEMIAANGVSKEDWLSRGIQSRLAPHEQAELATGIALLKHLLGP